MEDAEDIFDPLELLAAMGETTECRVGMAPTGTPMANSGKSDVCDNQDCAASFVSAESSTEDDDQALDETPRSSVAFWNHCENTHNSTPTLLDSLARWLANMRLHGPILRWTCTACGAGNDAPAFFMCRTCSTHNGHFAELVALSNSAAMESLVYGLHPLLRMAIILGTREVDACFSFVEAMAREHNDPEAGIRLYTRAFKLWPELDSDLCPDGVPIFLRADSDVLFKPQPERAYKTFPLDWELPSTLAIPKKAAPVEVSRPPVLESFDLVGIARYIEEHQVRRIVVMCGAGVSTSAGIPDFRSPGSGLYDNLQKYDLPRPEAMFSLDYFRRNPLPFYDLIRELWPGKFKPTPCHYFIRLIHEKGMLLRCYTQNIDSLETLAGLPKEKLVAAHGNFDAAHVIDTEPEVEVDITELRDVIENDGEQGWRKLLVKRGGLVKPKIVFFGEKLPDRFMLHYDDMVSCELLLVMGTSLAVAPFNSLMAKVGIDVPRVLINNEAVGLCETMLGGFRFHRPDNNHRDVFCEGAVDVGVEQLVAALGWTGEFQTLVADATIPP